MIAIDFIGRDMNSLQRSGGREGYLYLYDTCSRRVPVERSTICACFLLHTVDSVVCCFVVILRIGCML